MTELELVTQERDELKSTFDLRWDADMRAIKLWQAAHPDREDTWPDHADMVVWLLEQLNDLDWFCVYCGWTCPRSEPITRLQEHVMECEDHPVHSLTTQLNDMARERNEMYELLMEARA
jgi:hypothetical protein